MIVYLVTGNPVPFFAAIETALGTASHITVRRVLTPPAGRENEEESIAILDLSHPPGRVDPPSVTARSRTRYIVVIEQGESVPARWVDFLRLPAVEVVTVGKGMSALRYGGISSILARHRGDQTPVRLVELLVRREEWLGSCADLVRAILGSPWTVRDPCDLARASGLLEWTLRKRCEAAGFRRVEHFITMVRGLGVEVLTNVEHLRASKARTLVGIADPSNFRRQLRRVSYFRQNVPA